MDGSEARRASAMQTPLRGLGAATPVKTPLRTPLRPQMEQTSSTPITPFEAIEKQKENVQPRARGRSAHALSTAFSMHHKERQELLQQQRQEHERAVTSVDNPESDDPLEAWCAYVKWCVDNYPSGKSAESGIVPLLERATRTFKDSEQYRNDSRYLRLWILYAQHTDVPRDVFQFLLANEIGTRLAALYEELAVVLEAHGVYAAADATYTMGIARRAAPLDRLKRRYGEYQARILALPESSSDETPTYSKALATAMARVGRSVLGTKTAHGESKPTNVLGGHQPLSRATRPNARTMNVYRDENGDEAPAPRAASKWDELASEPQRRKENASAPRTLQPMHTLTPRTQARALEVFCDSDEDHASPERPTPRKGISQRTADTETDRLRKSPFLYYDQQDMQRAPPAEAPKAEALPAEAPKAEARRAEAPAPSKARVRSKAKAAHAAPRERHVAPLAAMYPGADVAACVADKHRPIRATHELCYDELRALRRDRHALDRIDPWISLDASHGRWLPERRRAASPTLVTKAAILEVDHMFNGESDDEESESESEASSASEGAPPVLVRRTYDENEQAPRAAATPQRGPRTPFGGAPRTPFGGGARTPLAARVPAASAWDDAAGADEADDGAEARDPNAPFVSTREPFQPLTPITERTEVSRWTSVTSADDSVADDRSHADAAPAARATPLGGLRADPATLALANPCSPADPDVVRALLANLATPVSSLVGFVDARASSSTFLADLDRRVKAHARRSVSGLHAASAVCEIEVADMVLAIHQKIGQGGYGAVFLAQDANGSVPLPGEEAPCYDELGEDDVEELERRKLLALKIERPANWWEFYVLHELHGRLPPALRASVVGARRFVAFADESMLLLTYGAQGTLLELVNHARSAGVGAVPSTAGGTTGGVEEVLAMFFMIDLLQLVEAMHRADVLHGDLKIDNCLVRAQPVPEGTAWPSAYDPTNAAWRSRGVMLIDFGRAIDLRCFPEGQTFLADWTPGTQDCVEMHEMRPWTYQADYYGLASIAYCLLFGKYIETTSFVDERGRKTYKIQQPLRRYWHTALWTRFFHVLLNPRHEGAWPIHDTLASLREEMQTWLAANSFRAGKNLKGLLKKMDIWALQT